MIRVTLLDAAERELAVWLLEDDSLGFHATLSENDKAQISAIRWEVGVEADAEPAASVLGSCPHGVDLDRTFCSEGCRV